MTLKLIQQSVELNLGAWSLLPRSSPDVIKIKNYPQEQLINSFRQYGQNIINFRSFIYDAIDNYCGLNEEIPRARARLEALIQIKLMSDHWEL